jgi:hypothetical protein
MRVVAVALAGLLALGLLLGGIGVSEAGKKKAKTKVTLKGGPEGAKGKVKSKQRRCIKKRKVVLKGPAPFDPNARASGGMVKIGKTKTNKRGRWSIPAPKGGFFTAGDYTVVVPKSSLGRFSAGFDGICLQAATKTRL